MTKSCYVQQKKILVKSAKKICKIDSPFPVSPSAKEIASDLDITALQNRIAQLGNTENEIVYGYVVRTVRPKGGGFDQQGSAPNFSGGVISLCTCKHSMRTALTPEQWKKGIWIAGLTGWNRDFNKQQSLFYLMLIGEAFSSQVELVECLKQTGRSSVVEAKASSHNKLGDLMIPVKRNISGDDRFRTESYQPPVLGHAHRLHESDTGWHDDIDYEGFSRRRPALLIGDSNFSFNWSRPIIRRTNPTATRPYRIWHLSDFLSSIEAVHK